MLLILWDCTRKFFITYTAYYGGLYMKKRSSNQKLKSIGSFVLILILLPYVITVFIHGLHFEKMDKNSQKYVIVKLENQTEEKNLQEVSWEEYLIGILAKDMPKTYHREALKAQVVLIRSNLYEQSKGDLEDYIFTEPYLSTEELERKWGIENFEETYKKFLEAVEEIGEQVLCYEGQIAWTPFHQSSNGMIRSAKETLGSDTYPYLVQKECPRDKEAEAELHAYVFEYTDIKEKCRAFLVAAEGEEAAKKELTIEDFEIQAKDSAGYVSALRIGNTICTGDQFRDALSLSSSDFSLQDDDGRLKITTTGNGHGLGMSQWTANIMAEEGSNYGEILQFFFEGTELLEGGEIFSKEE